MLAYSQCTLGEVMDRVQNNFRTLKVAIKLRGMIAKKNREVILDLI
jgi:hypothetical protein